MSVDRILGLEPGIGSASALRPATLVGAGTHAPGSVTGVRPLDTAAVLRVLIEEVRSVALDRFGFVPAPEREPFPVADRGRAVTVLLKIMSTIAGDPRFQPGPDEDPVDSLQDVMRLGAEQALKTLTRLPVAGAAPQALIEATRDAVAGSLSEPVHQRVHLARAVQQALVTEAEQQLVRPQRHAAPAAPASASGYTPAAPTAPPAPELLIREMIARTLGQGMPAGRADSPAAIWARIEEPVRAAFGGGAEVERVIHSVRERVLAAVVPAVPPQTAALETEAAEQFLERIATTLGTAVERPASLPALAVDARAITGVVVEALQRMAVASVVAPRTDAPLARAIDALQVFLMRESVPAPAGAMIPARTAVLAGPSTSPAVAEAHALLLRLFGAPETAEAARREPALVARWLGDVVAALARNLELPFRPDLVAPRRRPGPRRERVPSSPAGRDDVVTAIETSTPQERSDPHSA